MQVDIRKWNYNDASDIARLNHQWGYPSSVEEINQRLNELSASAGHELFVAEADGKLAGWLHVYRHFTMGNDAFAEIGGLVVDVEYRRQGVGKVLVEKAKSWTKENNINRLLVRTNVKREESNIFYTKCGFDLAKQQNVFTMQL